MSSNTKKGKVNILKQNWGQMTYYISQDSKYFH